MEMSAYLKTFSVGTVVVLISSDSARPMGK